jgi:hypothetical protein
MKGGWWSSKMARVVKNDSMSENDMRRKIIDELTLEGAAFQAKEAGWIIVEMANIKAEDGFENRQRVKLKLPLGALYVYEAEFTIYNVKGCDIVLGQRWMCDINR